jgi:hypothetical protein
MPRPKRTHALALLIALAVPATFAAHARAGDAPAWNVMVGDAVTDTLDAPLPQVLDAGRWVLERDKWTLAPGDPAAARIVTSWKAVHHPLVHMVAGEARVRLAIHLRPLPTGRTEVTLQGGLATETNLTGSPVVALARTAGEHESRSYFEEIRARLADERVAHADPAGSPAGSTPSRR